MKCLILDIEELISSKVSKVKYSDGSTRWQCNDCNYCTTGLTVLKRHVESKHVETAYYCDLCAHTAPTKHALNMHRSRKH